jgi:large repetitive protein
MQPGSTFSGLCAGNYTITIVDTNGCTDTEPVVLIEPAVLSFTAALTNLSCFQNFSGSVQLNATGGTTPYQYSFDNGANYTSSSSLNFTAAGTYDVIVRDQHNCQVTGQSILTEPTQLTASASTTATTCFGIHDGGVTISPAGGVPGYDYVWSPNSILPGGGTPGNTPTTSSLGAGSYSVETTDQNGCSVVTNFTINEPAQFIVDNVTTTQPTCNGLCDGSITINSATAVSYSFDGGATTGSSNTLSNVCAGNYNIRLADAAGCLASTSVTVSQPALLQIFSTPDSLMCTGDTLPLFALAVGGTSPYQFFWNNGVNQQSQNVHPLTSQSYFVHAVDANGCTTADSITDLTMMPLLTYVLPTDTNICRNFPVQLGVSTLIGYPPYSFQWSSGTNDTLSTVTVTPPTPTTYTVSVTDRCMTVTSSINVGFYAIPQVALTSPVQDGCSPLTIAFTPGVDPSLLSTCLWTFSNGQTSTNCSTITATFTEPGCYDAVYTGTSSDGCPVSANFTSVACVYPDPIAGFGYSPLPPSVLDNEVHFIDGSHEADTYLWRFGVGHGTSTEKNPIHQYLNMEPEDEVVVCLEVRSEQGCVDSACHILTFTDDFLIYVPNAFTPDGNERNNVLPEGADIEKYRFLIFNRWGEIVFESLNPWVGWDGTYHELEAPEGVYVWTIELREGYHDLPRKFDGNVTLLR